LGWAYIQDRAFIWGGLIFEVGNLFREGIYQGRPFYSIANVNLFTCNDVAIKFCWQKLE